MLVNEIKNNYKTKIKQRNIEALSLKKIAKNSNVSDATITRYCKELGYLGFIPFKKHLDAINITYVINNHEVIINRSLVESTDKFYDEYVNIYNRGGLGINYYNTKEKPPIMGYTHDSLFSIVFAEKGIFTYWLKKINNFAN